MDATRLSDCNPHELLALLKERYQNGTIMPVTACSMCKWICGYVFRGGQLFYDGGCDCKRIPAEPRDESRLLEKIESDRDWAVKLLTIPI